MGVTVEDAVGADPTAVRREHAAEGCGVDFEELLDTTVVPPPPVEDDRQFTLCLAMLRGTMAERGGVLLAGWIDEATLGRGLHVDRRAGRWLRIVPLAPAASVLTLIRAGDAPATCLHPFALAIAICSRSAHSGKLIPPFQGVAEALGGTVMHSWVRCEMHHT